MEMEPGVTVSTTSPVSIASGVDKVHSQASEAQHSHGVGLEPSEAA